MGVPSFYRWLVYRYPKAVVRAVEEEEPIVGDDSDWWAVTSSTPPNGPFDNLYLDMNRIINPCFHQDDQLFPPTTEDEVFAAMFLHIDRIFRVVRPRKLVYMAMDGVAPRAKLNQQRARRFWNAKEAELAEAEEEKLRREFQQKGKPVLPKPETQLGDSNIVTPGTAFMDRLSRALEYYIRSRLNSHPGWKSLKVILSNANVPGEGEHKVMAFIRLQRNLPGYDPNTRHCLYGLDADLIFLALATHELHISILSEDVLNKAIAQKGGMKPLQLLNIWTFREYLQQEFTIPEAAIKTDIERIVDDFVFMSYFAGNDFLPHLPSLQTNENGFDLLVRVYKEEFENMGGYLIDTTRLMEEKAAFVNSERVETFIQAVARYETKIFMKRYNLMQANLKRIMRQRMEESDSEACKTEFLISEDNVSSVAESNSEAMKSTSFKQDKCHARDNNIDKQREEFVLTNTKELKYLLKKRVQDGVDLFKHETPNSDKIMLGHPGFEERYYIQKFSVATSSDIQMLKKEVVQKYTEGLCWTLIYYYSGVASWQWFYPFNYAPFASDLKGMPWSSVCFNIGEPIKPFEQLLSVLPPRSAHVLPKAYGRLMTTKESTLAIFYPDDFEVDTHGKRFLWQGVVKLPFIDEAFLVAEARKLEKELEDEEIARNSFQNDRIFILKSHNLASQTSRSSSGVCWVEFCADGMNGYLCSSVETQRCDFPTPVVGMEDFQGDDTVCATYMNPDPHDHVPRLLQGIEIPVKTITASDIVLQRPLWHDYHGYDTRAPFLPEAAVQGNRRTVAGPSGCSSYGRRPGKRRGWHTEATRLSSSGSASDGRAVWRGAYQNRASAGKGSRGSAYRTRRFGRTGLEEPPNRGW